MAQALESQLQASITTAMSSYMQNVLGAYMQQMQTALETQVSAAMQQSMNQIAANMSNAMSIDESAFANAFQMNMDENDLTELMMSMMGKEDASYDNNLKKLATPASTSRAASTSTPSTSRAKRRSSASSTPTTTA